ncbi:MAG: hypothetical protein GOU99_04000 [Candidatus Altiarchaeota archaeon]|nr:hypothetical protein [Candidatus Altiarchaeota archaeon]
MKTLILAFLFLPIFAISLSSHYTSPTTLEDQGVLYVTFCSQTSEFAKFYFTPQGFTVSQTSVQKDFAGTTLVPDCKQITLIVRSGEPGLLDLKIRKGADEWVVPVKFEKKQSLLPTLSKSVIYTGYDDAVLRLGGTGKDVWVTLTGSIVGSNILYADSLPAEFPIQFHFGSSGYQEIPVIVQYIAGNSSVTQSFTLGLRVEEAPIDVTGDSDIPSGGFSNLTLHITAPEKLYSTKISLHSSCIEGNTERYFEEFQEGDVVFRVKGTCDPGSYQMNVSVGDHIRSIPIDIIGPGGYEVFFTPSFETTEASLEVMIANEGSESMKAVSVRLIDGNYSKIKEGTFIGDLEPGDYDSADLTFIPHKNPVSVNIKISFTHGGVRVDDILAYDFHYVQKNSMGWWFILILAGVGVWYVKRRKASN